MSEFVKSPNLPTARVSLVAVSSKYSTIIEQLEAIGLRVVAVPPCSALDEPVCCHADMLIHHLGGDRLLLYDYSQVLNATLIKAGFKLIFEKNQPQKKYPSDIGLNLLSLGKYLVGRIDKADPMLIAESATTTSIRVKQGYTKCSTAVVDETHVITTDLGIARSLEKNGISALVVSSAGIRLDGYDSGFIGGCCGKISEDTILFTGALSTISDGERIRKFIESCNVKIIELDSQLIDVGSILPLYMKFRRVN